MFELHILFIGYLCRTNLRIIAPIVATATIAPAFGILYLIHKISMINPTITVIIKDKTSISVPSFLFFKLSPKQPTEPPSIVRRSLPIRHAGSCTIFPIGKLLLNCPSMEGLCSTRSFLRCQQCSTALGQPRV